MPTFSAATAASNNTSNSTSTTASTTTPASFDLVVVGAGVVGLAMAWHAVRAGLRVAVVERDERAVGASVRNFGHVCITAQSGLAGQYARAGRAQWLELAASSGFDARESGSYVVARSEAQEQLLQQFANHHDGEVELLSPAQGSARLGIDVPDLRAVAFLPADLRVDSPQAVPAVAAQLEKLGVEFHWRENVLRVASGRVETSRGTLHAERIILAVGHDVDRFFPDTADEAEVLRCRLRMLEIDPPSGLQLTPGVLTGLSMLRYDGFLDMEASAAVREEFRSAAPELLDHGLNLMFTQRLSGPEAGRLVIGDTHHYSLSEEPFDDDNSDQIVLREISRLFGVEAGSLKVHRRWRGVYASSVQGPYLVASPLDGVTVTSVTSGIGMTTALGFAEAVLEGRHTASATPAPALATVGADSFPNHRLHF